MTTAVDDRPADADTVFSSPPTDLPPDAPPIHLAKCAECASAVRFRPSASGASFTLVDADPDQTFGIGEHGRPTCPNGHGEMGIADDQLQQPVPEAFANASAMLKRASDEASPRPVQGSLPGCLPPFNYEGAARDMAQQAESVQALKAIYDEDAKRAKKSKDAWESAEELLTKMGLTYSARMRQRDAGLEAADQAPDTGARSPRLVKCTWEAQHAGEECDLCNGEHAPQVLERVLGNPSALPPADAEAHVEVVDRLHAWLEVEEVQQALTLNLQTYLPDAVVAGWTPEERKAVALYCDQAASLACGDPIEGERLTRPAVLGTPHIPRKAVLTESGDAYEPQTCSVCDAVLPREDDTDSYAEEDFVGVDCPGAKGKKKPKGPDHHYPDTTRKKAAPKGKTAKAKS